MRSNKNDQFQELTDAQLGGVFGGGKKAEKAVEIIQAEYEGEIELTLWESVSVLWALATGVMAGPNGEGDYITPGPGDGSGNPFG